MIFKNEIAQARAIHVLREKTHICVAAQHEWSTGYVETVPTNGKESGFHRFVLRTVPTNQKESETLEKESSYHCEQFIDPPLP